MDNKILEITVPDLEKTCVFCHKHEVNTVEWGPLYELNDVIVHYFCLLFSAGLRQKGADNEGIWGFLTPDIWKEAKRGDKLKCKYCKKSRATVGCVVRSCKHSFHYTCGLEKGTLHQFFGSFSSYCPAHKPQQKVPDGVDYNCPICFLDVEKESDGVWPPCCGKKVFHRTCLMHTAKEAGYFFKCPLCNNSTDKFIVAMKANGVFVPEQDAAWEREPNAFAELREHYSKCDAPKCLCPDGREHISSENANSNIKWRIVRCNGCGASAVHNKCGGLNGVLSWKCTTCSNVLLEKNKINTSSLVSAVTLNTRRARVDEQNLNYSESDDETSEGDSYSTGDSETSDEEEKILRMVPNPASYVRNRVISSDSSDDSDTQSKPGGHSQSKPNASVAKAEKKVKSEKKVVSFEAASSVIESVEDRKRKRRPKTHHQTNDLSLKKKQKTDDDSVNVAIAGSSSASLPIPSKKGKEHRESRSKRKADKNKDLMFFQSKFQEIRKAQEQNAAEGETLRKLAIMLNERESSINSKIRAGAKKQQQILQSVLQVATEQRVDFGRLPKIPKVTPGSSSSDAYRHSDTLQSILQPPAIERRLNYAKAISNLEGRKPSVMLNEAESSNSLNSIIGAEHQQPMHSSDFEVETGTEQNIDFGRLPKIPKHASGTSFVDAWQNSDKYDTLQSGLQPPSPIERNIDNEEPQPSSLPQPTVQTIEIVELSDDEIEVLSEKIVPPSERKAPAIKSAAFMSMLSETRRKMFYNSTPQPWLGPSTTPTSYFG